jgi:hypothetical protein
MSTCPVCCCYVNYLLRFFFKYKFFFLLLLLRLRSQAAWLYPHIARRDAEEGVNRGWLATLTEPNFRFSTWREGRVAGRVRAPGGCVRVRMPFGVVVGGLLSSPSAFSSDWREGMASSGT